MADKGLVAGLMRPDAYPFVLERIEVMETHISWVILTGPFAYKIKKPVNFGFLDFSSLEDRKHYCEEELRLNRRLAPDVYLAVVPITGTAQHPQMEGEGTTIEYAVKMRQFDNADRFDAKVQAGHLSPESLDKLADRLAVFHNGLVPATTDTPYGSPEAIYDAACKNFQVLAEQTDEAAEGERLQPLARWTEQQYHRLYAGFASRKAEGYIRECHGDLHLGNIVLLNDEPVPFDAIEFNPALRWIDLMSELAFLVMDLEVRHQPGAGFRCLNHYLATTGDYPGLRFFTFYRVYRAMVRAKITQLSRNRQTETPEQRTHQLARYRAYIDYALDLTGMQKPRLILLHGVSGSGKSRLAMRLAECLPAIVLRADVERKRLYPRLIGTSALYDPACTARTYQCLLEWSRMLLDAGFNVVVDATFLDPVERLRQQQMAAERGLEWIIFSCTASTDILRQRIEQRATTGSDPSDATVAVLERQLARYQPLNADERTHTVIIDSQSEASLECGLREWLAGLRQPVGETIPA